MSSKIEKLVEKKIKTGLQQLHEGKGIQVNKAMKQLIKKYDLPKRLNKI